MSMKRRDRLVAIYKGKRGFIRGFEFTTACQDYVENFMSWYLPDVDYWLATVGMIEDHEQDYTVDTEYPHHWRHKGKVIFADSVIVQKKNKKKNPKVYQEVRYILNGRTCE